ncbi:hypothetical protein [Terrarubrum flagellatum]
MLKLILSLVSDWNAYRRMMAWGEAPRRCLLARFADVSTWPMESVLPH